MLGTSVAQMWAGQVAHFIDPNNAKTLSLPGGCSRWTRSCCNQPVYQYSPGEFCGPLRPDEGYSKRDTGVSGFVSHSSATSFPRVCLFFGSTPRFSSNNGSPEGLMANKVRGIVGHGLRTPFPSGYPWDVSSVVRSYSASAPSSLLVLGEISDTGESAVATLNIRGQRTRLACALLFCFSAHPAKTCQSLRRAILYVACTSLRPQTQGTA